jgi:hypothetical protein
VCAVDLIEGGPGLEPERPEPDHTEDLPRGEVAQRRAEHHEVGRGGLDQIARAYDQRQPERADEAANLSCVPSADSCTVAEGVKDVASFDDLVGAGEEHRWHVDTKCLSGPEVDQIMSKLLCVNKSVAVRQL